MIQEILTYITVSAAFAYTIYSFWKIIFPDEGKTACSGGCSTGCEAKTFIMDAAKNKKQVL